MRLTLIFSLLVAIVAVVFALQNPQMMEVNLLFLETQGSAALVLLVTFAIGVVVGLLSTLPGRFRDKRKIKKLKKDNAGASPNMPTGPSAMDMPDPSAGRSSSSSDAS
jgi:putative membrane protein